MKQVNWLDLYNGLKLDIGGIKKSLVTKVSLWRIKNHFSLENGFLDFKIVDSISSSVSSHLQQRIMSGRLYE